MAELNPFDFTREIETLKSRAMYRDIHPRQSESLARIEINHKKYLNLCSNDYLGLSRNSEIKQAICDATHKWGSGSGGARLLGGATDLHEQLEQRICTWKGFPASLLFSTGWTANYSTISALGDRCRAIYSDRLNHASINEAIAKSGKRFYRYKHLDLDHLSDLLKKQVKPDHCLVVTETLFSMEGDFSDIDGLLSLQSRYGFFLYIDEAHSTGIYNMLHNEAGRNPKIALMGTFGKALGGFGAYLACSKPLRDYLINKSRPFIFTTSLPPSVIAAAHKSVEIVENHPEKSDWLRQISKQFISRLKEFEIDTGNSSSQIIPVIVGSNQRAIYFSRILGENGIFTMPIRHPTVPRDKARLRINLRADFSRDDVEMILENLVKINHEQ